MKDLIIVGAGHLGIDVFSLVANLNIARQRWNIKGFINDIPVDLSKFRLPIGIIGTIEDWVPSPNEVFALAIGNPKGKETVAKKLKARGAVFPTLVNLQARVADTAELGEGVIVFNGSQIAPCAKIGDFSVIGHSIVGMCSEIGAFSNTAAWVNVYQDVTIGKRCQLWSHSVILNSIGDDVVVGAGSVVVNKVKSGTTVFGNPAKRMDW